MSIIMKENGEHISDAFMGELMQGTGFVFDENVYIKSKEDGSRKHANAFNCARLCDGHLKSILAERMVTPVFLDIEWELCTKKGVEGPPKTPRNVTRSGYNMYDFVRLVWQKKARHVNSTTLKPGDFYVYDGDELYIVTDGNAFYATGNSAISVNMTNGRYYGTSDTCVIPVNAFVQWERMAIYERDIKD